MNFNFEIQSPNAGLPANFDEKKFWDEVEKLTASKAAVNELRTNFAKFINSERTTPVDKAVSNSERRDIESSLKSIFDRESEFKNNQEFAKGFRMELPANKSEQWEIQRNIAQGTKNNKTSVAQAISISGFQQLLNSISNQHANAMAGLQRRYERLVCLKLRQSLNSEDKTVKIAFLTPRDLMELFFKEPRW